MAWCEVEATSVSVSSATSLTCVVPTIGSEGAKNVVITTSGGTATASSAFTYYNAYSASLTSYTSAGSGTYAIPAWCNKIDVVVMGGGGSGGGSVFANWGGGGDGGAYNYTTLTRGSEISWATSTLSYTVGAGGAATSTSDGYGNSGASSTGHSTTASGGAGGSRQNNGPAGTTTAALTLNGETYPSAVGGNYGDSSNANANPGSGGGGGNSFSGPYVGKAGRAGAVYFRAYQ